MKRLNRSAPLETNTIKGLDPVEQAAVLRSLVPQYLARAATIRDALETHSRGIVNISIKGTDEEVVLLALLTSVADDIGSIPDAKRMSALMRVQERVMAELGLEKEDVQFFIRNLELVFKVLAG